MTGPWAKLKEHRQTVSFNILTFHQRHVYRKKFIYENTLNLKSIATIRECYDNESNRGD